MGKLILFMHTSLDLFAAGPGGEMDWITINDEIFRHVEKEVSKTDTALYGRVTYNMMEGYWPTAADQINATEHDINHAAWYKNAKKIVLSRSLQGQQLPNTIVISDNISEQVSRLKHDTEGDILIFGSPSAAHALMSEDLIDGYWLFINPVLLGKGIPVFDKVSRITQLDLQSSHIFSAGVVCVRYARKSS